MTIKNNRPEVPEDLSPEALRQAFHELQVRQSELLMQNAELRRALTDLEASNNRYLNYYNLAPVGFCTLSDKGLILAANLTFAAWMGVEHGELVNQPLTRFILPEDQDIYCLHRRQLFEAGEPQTCQLRLLCRDKKTLWVNIEATAARDPDGVPVCRIVLSDITGRKRAEKALAEKEEMYRLIFNSVPTAIFHYDNNGTIKTCNPKALSLFSVSENQIIGLNILEVSTDERVLHCVKTALSGTPSGFAGEYTTTTGKKIHIDSYNVPIFSDDGTVSGAIVVMVDIGDKIAAEQALRESEKNLASIFNAITETVFLMDDRGILQSVNKTAAKRLGLATEDMTGKLMYDFLPESLANSRREKIEEVFRTGREARFEDSRDGLHFRNAIYPVFDDDGKVARLAVFAQNITGLRIAEEALRESEKNLASMFNSITESVFLLDPQGVLLSVNETTAKRLGSTPDGVKGRVAYDFLPKEAADSRREIIEEVFRTGREAHFEDSRNGKAFKHALYPVFDDDGKVSRLAVFSQDITGLKMAEEALRESEKNLATMFNAITESVFLLDAQGLLLSMNRTTAQRFDSTAGNMKGKVACSFMPRDVALFRKTKNEEVFRTGREVHFEDIRDGRHFKHALYPVFDDDGKVSRLAGFSQDVTDQKRAEEELRASHAQLRELSKHLQTAREQERIRIARGIHDELGQVLTAIILETSRLAKKMPKNLKALKSSAIFAAGLAKGAVQSVRKIIAELRPALLSDLGLAEAIKWQAGEYGKRTGIACAVCIDLKEIQIIDEISTAIFRIFQEAFTNVIRHAKATEMSVSLKAKDGYIELVIEDNGVGLDVNRRMENTFGIIGMKERAQVLGGKFDIFSTAGKGTSIFVEVPVRDNSPPA